MAVSFVEAHDYLAHECPNGRACQHIGGPVGVAVHAGIADCSSQAVGRDLYPERFVMFGNDRGDRKGFRGVPGRKGAAAAEWPEPVSTDALAGAAALDGIFERLIDEPRSDDARCQTIQSDRLCARVFENLPADVERTEQTERILLPKRF